MEENQAPSAPKPLSPLEMNALYEAYQAQVMRVNASSSLEERYQAHTTLVSMMKKIHSSVTAREMAEQKGSYVVGVVDAPKSKLYRLYFFSDSNNLTQFVENISKKGKIYHCTDKTGQTIAIAA